MTELIITSSVLILIVIVVRHFLKGKINLQLQYALWALVLMRLLVPVSFFSSPISVMNAVQKASAYTYAEKALEDTRIYSDFIRNTEMTPDEAREAGRGTLHEIHGYPVGSGSEHLHSYIFMDSLSAVLERVLNTIWFIGTGTVGAILLLSNLSFGRKLKKTRKRFPADVCKLPVYEVEALPSPCLFGFFRPAIYITPDVAADEAMLRHVLVHELTHYRHRDHIWAVLRSLCLAVHWYNPLVWLAAALSRRDSELACDEGTIKQIGEASRMEYGRTLIGLTCERRGALDLLCCATTMTDGKKGIRERIALIAKKPKMLITTLIAVLLIASVAVGCTFTGAKLSDDATGTDDKTSADDPYFNVSAADPAETVMKFLEAEKEQEYTISLEIFQVAVSESDTAEIIGRFRGSDYARSKNWTGEFVENNIVAVAAYYAVQYDHSKTFFTDGELVRRFYLAYDDETALWSIWDNDGGIELDAFLNGNMQWPDCLTKPESIGSVMDGIDVPDAVLAAAKAQVAGSFEMDREDFPQNEYSNWRIESLALAYQYEALDGRALDIYRLNYELLSNAPEKVSLAGGMYITEDNWVCPSSPDCTYLVVNAADNALLCVMMENDCSPGDKTFTDDLTHTLVTLDYEASGTGIVATFADIDRDGTEETIYLDKSQMESGKLCVTLRVFDRGGNEIWSEDAYTAHAGWNSLFLCMLDGQNYLLRYNPYMGQGYCTYTYTLFTLEGGSENVFSSKTIEFDINGTAELDAPKMVAFADEVNALLSKSILLLSSEGGNYAFGPSPAAPFSERYSWLDGTPELYADSDNLEARLGKYSAYAAANRG